MNTCLKCLRLVATQDDWDKYEPGEGGHLCWEPGETCMWEPDFETEPCRACGGSGKVKKEKAE